MAALQALYDLEIEWRRERIARDLREKYPQKNLYELKKLYDATITYDHICALDIAVEVCLSRKWVSEGDVSALETACRIDGYDYICMREAGFKF